MATIVTRAGKGSALTWTEGDANITNLNNAKIENVVEDTTPQLGGNLDVNDKEINNAVTNGNLVLTTNGTGYIHANTAQALVVGTTTVAGAILSYGAQDLFLSTDVGANSNITIKPGANGNIQLNPSGTGKIVASKDLEATTLISTSSSGDEGGEIRLAVAQTNTTLSTSVTLDIYQNKLRIFETGGTNRGAYIDLSAATAGVGSNLLSTGGITDIVQDTTPQLGGSLDVNGNSIVSTSNGNIVLAPNGTGDVQIDADTLRIGDVNTTAILTTNGTGNLVISTNSGTNSGSITVVSGLNNDISITPNGTGGTVVKNLEYYETVFSLGTTSGTIAPNAANGNIQTITLNGNLTINAFTGPISGQTITLIINTNGTNRTLTSTMLFAGGSKTLSITNTVDILTISYIGTTYYASLVKGYA